jgi:hypothetical protein
LTEDKWLAANDPVPMLEFVAGKASARKLRLFACACVRSYWRSMREPDAQRLLDLVECYVDGKTTVQEIGRIGYGRGLSWILRSGATEAAHWWAGTSKSSGRPNAACLLRELFGNPFRPVPPVEPAWLTWNGGTVSTLATAMYDSGDFARTPLLADALEDAGCADAELLGHLRGPGPHARGCWALDLVLRRT